MSQTDLDAPTPLDPGRDHDLVVVVDFGAQYAQLIARRVREARVYSEIVPHTASVGRDRWRAGPKAIILSGGPQSSTPTARPSSTRQLFDAGVPVFGICYGFQAMAQALGGDVARTGLQRVRPHRREITDAGHAAGRAAGELPGLDEPRRRGGRGAAEGFDGAGRQRRRAGRRVRERRTAACRRAVPPGGAAHPARPAGAERFLYDIAGLRAGLDAGQHRRRTQVAAIRAQVGDKHGRSAGCPAGWTPRWPPRWCSAPSATS